MHDMINARCGRLATCAASLLLMLATACSPPPPLPTTVTPTADKTAHFDFERYPDAIWDRHQSLTRKASSVCRQSGSGAGGYTGCIYATLDNYVRDEKNPALSDLHSYLPLNYRYDPDRNQRPTALLPKPYP